jgi:hypothetical protein
LERTDIKEFDMSGEMMFSVSEGLQKGGGKYASSEAGRRNHSDSHWGCAAGCGSDSGAGRNGISGPVIAGGCGKGRLADGACSQSLSGQPD